MNYDFDGVDSNFNTVLSVIKILSSRAKSPLDPIKVTTWNQIEFALPRNGTTVSVSQALTL